MVSQRSGKLGKEHLEQFTGALCFEYLHKGSLQNHLSDESCGLDWHTRYKIIKGTCEGLRYIHGDLEKSLLHLDLKPENILLDKNMVPKIADFGLSRIFGDELTRTTRSPLGTTGYQPPEYIDRGEISEKFDIFSMGVVIIRIVSGPNGYSIYLDKPDEFIDQVQRNWRKRWQETCSNHFSLEVCCRQVKTCTQIALDCLEKDSQKRPNIIKIIDKLNEVETDKNELPQERRKTVCSMRMHNEMKRTKEHKEITDQHQNYSNFMVSSRSEIDSYKTRETSFDVGKEMLIVGREEEKKRMASLLESKSEKIVIFPICGIGGIGKTTFVKLIYNDTNLKYYSQVWVYVSPRFDLYKIGNSIVSQLSGKENQADEIKEIKRCLAELFSGKKILIVLDDLWEDNPIKIEELKDMLNPGESIKIIVLVTTRSEDIAKKICCNIEGHKLKALTDEMCWDIIKKKSGFDARNDKENLMGVGKEIARKCFGVALAAQTLGSMLQSMKYEEWMTVKASGIWNETISDDISLPNYVLASLKLSYVFSMDDCLKSCFTYCAIFPKGHKIVKYDLIHQWISLGFIKPTKILSALQLCEKYIVHLLGLTFIQHSMPPTMQTYNTHSEHGTEFMMHDLVHDLAISLLGDKILDQSKQGIITRGSSSCYALLADCSKPLESCMVSPSRLCALRFLDCWMTVLHGAAFEPAESLRVLDLSDCLIHQLPDSIGRLKELRYLNAPRIRYHIVPKCITNLSNLRYISLRGSYAILALPESIGEMKGLVHLDLSGCMGLEVLPKSFPNLKSLEHVDFTNCRNVKGVSQCLATLTKLQHLNLSNCENWLCTVTEATEFTIFKRYFYFEYIRDTPRALGNLTELQYLNLSNSSYLSGDEVDELEFLGSLTKLKYLNLSLSNILHTNTRLPETLASLTDLKYLILSHHSTMQELPESFGNLCNLVHLDLSWCYSLRKVPAALNGLTKLQYLDLYTWYGSNAMEGLQEVFGNLSELRHLNFCCYIDRMSSSHTDKINRLLERICTLTNLEFLNLCYNHNISSLPDTNANLRKLHTRDLWSYYRTRKLPASIAEIDSLKFLYAMGCSEFDRPMLPQYEISPYFVVHTGHGEFSRYPFQLEYEIPDRLKISRLENVKSSKEAQTIELVQKTDFTLLEIEWTRDAKRFVDDAEILRELEPPNNVSEFCLHGYSSHSFPSWVMRIAAYIPGVTRIEMSDMPSVKNLPPLGQLPKLKWLKIRRMDSIKRIDADLYGGTRAFRRLEQFRLHGMKCLEEWNLPMTAYSSDEEGFYEHVFPCLSFVEIRHCPMLKFKPHPPRSIDVLWVYSSDEVLLSSWWNTGYVCTSAATTLSVECCMVPLHRWSLLRHLPFLKHLWIKKCSDLTCSSRDFLGGLTCLQTLTVRGCKSITSLPEWLGDLTSLTHLGIRYCRSIDTLPDSIRKLTQLHLEIFGCPKLARRERLEEEEKHSPGEMRGLTSDEESETYEEIETDEDSDNEVSESYWKNHQYLF